VAKILNKISPCLWFDKEAEQAMNYYLSIFKNGKAGEILRYGEARRCRRARC